MHKLDNFWGQMPETLSLKHDCACIHQPLAGEGEVALERPTLHFAESREETFMTTKGREILKEVVNEHLESTEHHSDDQLVTCSISTAYFYVNTVTLETWKQTNILRLKRQCK